LYIQKETIELVRERASIVEIIKKYVPSLKPRGKNYIGLCPFHKEKTPSFTVSPDKEIFYCFGCHTGGNVFSFISNIERLDFPESVRFVADIAGIEIKEEDSKDSLKYDEINRINSFALKVYSKYLNSDSGLPGREYLEKRGVEESSINQFKLGYAPDKWDFLTSSLKKHKADLNFAEETGILSSSDKDGRKHFYDRFRSRIIFPIFDINNRAIAFGGRATGDINPKYLNSPESIIFQKRKNLYGLNFARKSIRELNRVIIVEGYLDVIGCHQAGIVNVVAPLGTALTIEQVKSISRLCKEIVLLFDADSAGINAALKSIQIINETNADVLVAMLPESDPFEYIQKKGIREFMTVVDSAIKPVDFRISRIMNSYNSNGRINTLISLFSVLKSISYESERSIYLRKISSMLDIDENSVRADFTSYLKKGSLEKNRNSDNNKPENSLQNNFIARSFRELIALICCHPILMEKAVVDFEIDDITDPEIIKILKAMITVYSDDGELKIDKIFDLLSNDQEISFLNKALNSPFSLIENPVSAYTEIYLTMKRYTIDQKIKKYAELISKNSNKPNHYLTEIEILEREREKLSSYIATKGRN